MNYTKVAIFLSMKVHFVCSQVSNFDDNMLLVALHDDLFPLGHRILAGISTIAFIHAALW